MTASASSITLCGSGVEPADPWVSTVISTPARPAAASSDSAAMYVWAIPVGHEVTATRRRRRVIVPVPAVPSVPLDAGLLVTGLPEAGLPGARTTPPTRSTTSSARRPDAARR